MVDMFGVHGSAFQVGVKVLRITCGESVEKICGIRPVHGLKSRVEGEGTFRVQVLRV